MAYLLLSGNRAPAAAALAAPNAPAPIITSPHPGESYLYGEPIPFVATDSAGECLPEPGEIVWNFHLQGEVGWHAYTFTPDRMLGAQGLDKAMLLPGSYEVTVKMCEAESPPVSFTVGFADPVTGQAHPVFSNPEAQDYFYYREGDDTLHDVDWDDENALDDHLTTAHFNVFWNAEEVNQNGNPVDITPTVERLGLMECVYAHLSRWMTSPLSDQAIFSNYGDYADFTHLTLVTGGAPEESGGGGAGEPLGVGLRRGARETGNPFGLFGNTTDWVPVHELFHVFDYAGNPLHNRGFDYRYSENAYHFYHEATTRIEQTMAPLASTFWGQRSDRWPFWSPLDLGMLEMDYDGGIFWTYVMDNFSDTFTPGDPRETWEGPPYDACSLHVELDPVGDVIRPHHFKLFEAWNSRVRALVQASEPATPLEEYADICPTGHKNPDPDSESFLYNGILRPECLQTLEFELDVLETLIGERVPTAGTPLEESLLMDFAVQFAEGYAPVSLVNDGLPQMVTCNDRPGITFASGFAATLDTCGGDPPVIPDAPVCDAVADVNPHDFYARIKFTITEAEAHYLWLRANDDATLYVDGLAVIGQEIPGVDISTSDFPNASSTYGDQSLGWTENHAPRSSIFYVDDPLEHTYEIEWVNRGDGKGNSDTSQCSADRSRYLLTLEWNHDPDPAAFQLLEDDQIEILSSRFWPGQGSGYPGFNPPPDAVNPYNPNDYHPIVKEVQLRPVAWLEQPFLLPSMGVHYHPVQCPADYTGDLEVTIRTDPVLTHTLPSAHLLVMRDIPEVEWLGSLEPVNGAVQRIILACDGIRDTALFDDDPAVLLVIAHRTIHPEAPENPYGTLGAIHYTVFVKPVLPFQVFLPNLSNRIPWIKPLPVPLPSRTPTPSLIPTTSPIPTKTATRTATRTPTLTPTGTALQTSSPTQTASRTPTPAQTATFTPTPTNTHTPSPTQTPTATPSAVTIVLTPMADAYISFADPDTNYGLAWTLYVGKSDTTIGRSLFQFNLEGIPSGATVLSASFQAYLVTAPPTPPWLDIELRRNEGPWSETSVSWNTQPGTTSIGKVNSVGLAPMYYAWDAAGLVQDWVSGDIPNHGMALWSFTETSLGWRSFASRESGSPPFPPQLVVTYRP
jgi:hypothetical protein